MPKDKLLLYSPVTGPRLTYIAGHLALEILGVDIIFTESIQEARSSALPLINYSPLEIPGAVNILPHGLLEETGICRQKPEIRYVGNIPVIFYSENNLDIRFDVFAASFYLISRYEEYLPFRKDVHGRFPFRESLMSETLPFDLPLIELWASILKDTIIKQYPRVTFPEGRYKFIPTIDIDIPWAYSNRGFLRTSGGFIKSVMKGDAVSFKSRFNVLFRGRKDPYDTFGKIEKIHSQFGLSPVYFFSVGRWGRYDKNVSPANPQYRHLISSIAGRYESGVHPSYNSFDHQDVLKNEINEFSGITGTPAFRSRQHFLRLRLPESYRLLTENGISEDYTMGWAETAGFRAGTCNPFMFYDLEKESVSTLKIFPFQIMDGSLRDYLNLDPDQASELACRIARKVREVNGTLITLWHNETFSGSRRWENWDRVYLDILNCMADGGSD
jgi:hypothetical protein